MWSWVHKFVSNNCSHECFTTISPTTWIFNWIFAYKLFVFVCASVCRVISNLLFVFNICNEQVHDKSITSWQRLSIMFCSLIRIKLHGDCLFVFNICSLLWLKMQCELPLSSFTVNLDLTCALQWKLKMLNSLSLSLSHSHTVKEVFGY